MIPDKIKESLANWSPRWRPGRFKATLVGLVVAAFAVPLLLLAMPYIEWFNDMAVQPRGKAQSLYGWFTADHARLPIVERPPVAGTVPMGDAYRPPHRITGKDVEDAAERAGAELSNPFEPTIEVLNRGEKLFNVFCIVCHGERAEGNGPVTGADLFPAPPSLLTEQARAYPDGRIYHVITVGQNKMPSYADLVAPDDRWAVAHYVKRVLQELERESEEER